MTEKYHQAPSVPYMLHKLDLYNGTVEFAQKYGYLSEEVGSLVAYMDNYTNISIKQWVESRLALESRKSPLTFVAKCGEYLQEKELEQVRKADNYGKTNR